jgi:tRNA G18 (ribose-2'-O)-methylase SpoU
VQNPHNLGTILRTAAYLGAGAVVGRAGELPAVSPAAARVAEGAAEIVPVVACADPVADFNTRLEADLEIFETDLAFARCGFPVLFAFDWERPLLAHVMYFSAMWCVEFGSSR